MEIQSIIHHLVCVHLELNGDQLSSSEFHVRSYRDLFSIPTLAQSAQKIQLLVEAEKTSCVGVIMDVLLFISQTMEKEAFQRALANTRIAKQHWIQYELSQMQINEEVESIDTAIISIASLLRKPHTSPQDVAIFLLSQVLRRDPTSISLSTALQVTQELIEPTLRYRLPSWAIALLKEFIQLSTLQLEVEAKDSFYAPEPVLLSGYFDKRSRGTSSIQTNWRVRHIELTPHQIVYRKHDKLTASTSRNPFVNSMEKGIVEFTQYTLVTPLNYVGKVSRRPYCIQIGATDQDPFIFDTVSPTIQMQWIDALKANIRRLGLDIRWLESPRTPVDWLTPHAFLRYCLLYHYDDENTSHTNPETLVKVFTIDPKRFLFVSILCAAITKNWTRMEKLLDLWIKPRHSFTFLQTHPFFGYGPILDIAQEYHAPVTILMTLETLYTKYDQKEKVWTCYSKEKSVN